MTKLKRVKATPAQVVNRYGQDWLKKRGVLAVTPGRRSVNIKVDVLRFNKDSLPRVVRGVRVNICKERGNVPYLSKFSRFFLE